MQRIATIHTKAKGASKHGSSTAVCTALLVTSLFMSGFNGILASDISLPSFQIVLLRAVIGAAILGAMLIAVHKPLEGPEHKREVVMLAGAGAALGADWLFLFEAYNYAGVGLSTILCYCAPIFVMALSPALFKERFTFVKTLGFLVVVAGAMLVNGAALSNGASAYGIVCGLASAACLATMMILNKKVTHVRGVEKVLVEIASAAAVVAVYTAMVKGVTISNIVASVLPSDVIPIVLIGMSTAFGNYLYLKGVDGLPVQSVAVLGYIEPLSAVMLSAALLGEALLPLQLAGGACIVCGALASEVLGARKLRKARAAR